jgi:hypothetical protein
MEIPLLPADHSSFIVAQTEGFFFGFPNFQKKKDHGETAGSLG